MNAPRIATHDDISEMHQEVPGYKYCIRINFEHPFYDLNTEELSDVEINVAYNSNEYANAQALYEEEARKLLCLPVTNGVEEVLYDWRDEQELWVRFNHKPAPYELRATWNEDGNSLRIPFSNNGTLTLAYVEGSFATTLGTSENYYAFARGYERAEGFVCLNDDTPMPLESAKKLCEDHVFGI